MPSEPPIPLVAWPAAASGPSILYDRLSDRPLPGSVGQPACFGDLALDQVVASALRGRDEYELDPFFRMPLHRVEAVVYRHETFQDLKRSDLVESVRDFATRMRTMRKRLAQVEKLRVPRQKQAWFVDATAVYVEAVRKFADDLANATLRSRAFLSLRDWALAFASSPDFLSLGSEIEGLRARLASIEYCVLVKAGSFQVRKPADEYDYSADVEDTFARFRQDDVENHLVAFHWFADMDHIEAQVLEFVARLYPGVFADLEAFPIRNAGFLDETVAAFDREVQFYLAWIEHADKFKSMGLSFCYPEVTNVRKDIHVSAGFDLALADKLSRDGKSIVVNDFALSGPERVIVVSGPNQGGKTTFARLFGQLHYLAALGCPTPGCNARLFLLDSLFTHFEREERVENVRGNLEDDLVRVRDILERATPDSVIVMNEIFTSTTFHDALFLSERVMETIVQKDLLCVWVTFVDELAAFGPQTVSMASTVEPDNLTRRTFRIVRKPADGLAYALAIAEKYRVTYQALTERVRT